MKKHLVFVVNPMSGTQRKKPLQPFIDQYLDHQQYSYEIAETHYPNHGTEIARKAAANGHFAVVAVGGDGSVNDIAAGLLHTDTAMAIIPKGSGNGLARALHLPLGYRRAIEKINEGRTLQMDVGRANEHIFVSNAGVGFDAYVMQTFEGNKRRGLWEYAKVIMQGMSQYRHQKVTVQLGDDSFTEKVFLVTVANGSQYGYNFRITREASVCDGLLDVVVLRKFPFYYYPIVVWLSHQAALPKSRYVTHYKVCSLTLSGKELTHFQTDGEPKTCAGSVHIEVLQGAVRVVV